MTYDLRSWIESVRAGDIDPELCPTRLIPSDDTRGVGVWCWYCTSEACATHGHDPCDCDSAERHDDPATLVDERRSTASQPGRGAPNIVNNPTREQP